MTRTRSGTERGKMRGMIRFIQRAGIAALAAALVLAYATSARAGERKEVAPDSNKKTEDRGVTHPLAKGKVVLDFGQLVSFSVGGGDTHDGEEDIRINPGAMIGFHCFAIKGFGLGLIGSLSYTKSRTDMTMLYFSFRLNTNSFNWHVGPSFVYYFSASKQFFPYLRLSSTYGQSTYDYSPIGGRTKVDRIDLTAAAGITYVIRNFFGIGIELYHTRDFHNPGGALKMGHLTGINFGFKLFI